MRSICSGTPTSRGLSSIQRFSGRINLSLREERSSERSRSFRSMFQNFEGVWDPHSPRQPLPQKNPFRLAQRPLAREGQKILSEGFHRGLRRSPNRPSEAATKTENSRMFRQCWVVWNSTSRRCRLGACVIIALQGGAPIFAAAVSVAAIDAAGVEGIDSFSRAMMKGSLIQTCNLLFGATASSFTGEAPRFSDFISDIVSLRRTILTARTAHEQCS